MSILLDTCVLLWLSFDQDQLSEAAAEEIRASGEESWVSAISAFEIAQKYRLKKLALPIPADLWYPQTLRQHNLREIAITGTVAARSCMLPMIHRDPADRFLIATALEMDLRLITPDPEIKKYPGVRVVW